MKVFVKEYVGVIHIHVVDEDGGLWRSVVMYEAPPWFGNAMLNFATRKAKRVVKKRINLGMQPDEWIDDEKD